MKKIRLLKAIAMTSLALIFLNNGAVAQSYPDKPITIVSPYAPGSLVDLLARTVGNEISVSLKQPVIVDNRPGAGQVIGASYVARSAPNGYTLMITLAPNLVSPSVQKGLPYKDNTDFTPIAHLVQTNVFLAVSPNVPASNFAEFLALLKANPGKYSYISSGVGSGMHVAGENFQHIAGVKALHIPYKTFQAGLTDIMNGQVSYGFVPLSAMQFVQSGKLKSFGIANTSRDAGFPDVPSLDEQGLKGFDASGHYMIVGPKGMPRDIVTKLNATINAAVASEAFQAKIKTLGGLKSFNPPLTPAQVGALQLREEERLNKLVKDQNIVLE